MTRQIYTFALCECVDEARILGNRREAPMPLIRRCGCLSLRTACLILCIMSILACVGNIAAGAWELPRHRTREPEDNLISLSMVMFSSLSAVSNITALFGICLRRPNYLQMCLMSNSVFIVCIYLVAVVTCVFRLDDYMKEPVYVVLVVLLLFAGVAFSIFYLIAVNSLYRTMKLSYAESPVPI